MEQHIFEEFQSLILRESGISLKQEKKVLLENRIRKRMKSLSISEPSRYLEVIESDLDNEEMVHLLDAVSTNHTYFFREDSHFVVLAKLLKEQQASGKNDFRMWCAASSSGEEPYTLLMTAAEALDLSRAKFRLLATDISMSVLQKASAGQYEEQRMEGIPPELVERYFDRLPSSKREHSVRFQTKRSLRELALFKRLNLSNFPYPLKGGIDIIFCRNVMIYFDSDLQQRIIQEFHRLLAPGGHLFLGHSEASAGQAPGFKRFEGAVFQKIEGAS